MPNKYVFQWDYKNPQIGSFGKGESAVFEQETADFLNRDSPGVLKLKSRAIEQPPNHRMVTRTDVGLRDVSTITDEVTVEATAAAVTLAKAHKVDLSKVKGTGKNGRIMKSDVEKVLPPQPAKPVQQGTKFAGTKSGKAY